MEILKNDENIRKLVYVQKNKAVESCHIQKNGHVQENTFYFRTKLTAKLKL